MPLVVVADNLRSLYNIGSIFRTSDAILVEKIFLCGISGKPPNKEIEKVALGAVETVPFEYCTEVGDCVRRLRLEGYQIVVLELTKQSVNYRLARYEKPLALILGNEIDGVSDEVLAMADLAVDIPMRGRANSLNVATAFAVVGYDVYDKFQS